MTNELKPHEAQREIEDRLSQTAAKWWNGLEASAANDFLVLAQREGVAAAVAAVEECAAPDEEIGRVYWMAFGTLYGCPWDLRGWGEECETADEAADNARGWLGDLSRRERETAQAWIRCYQVIALGQAVTINCTRDGEHVEA